MRIIINAKTTGQEALRSSKSSWPAKGFLCSKDAKNAFAAGVPSQICYAPLIRLRPWRCTNWTSSSSSDPAGAAYSVPPAGFRGQFAAGRWKRREGKGVGMGRPIKLRLSGSFFTQLPVLLLTSTDCRLHSNQIIKHFYI